MIELIATKDSRAMNSSAPSIPRIRSAIANNMSAKPELLGRSGSELHLSRALHKTYPANAGTKNP